MAVTGAGGHLGGTLVRRLLESGHSSIHALLSGPEVSSVKAEQRFGYTKRPTDETVADKHEWFDSTSP